MGSHPGEEFSVGRQKWRLARLDIRILRIFTIPVEAPTAKNTSFVGAIPRIGKASHTADFSGKLNSASNKRIRESKMENSFRADCVPLATNRETKGESDGYDML